MIVEPSRGRRRVAAFVAMVGAAATACSPSAKSTAIGPQGGLVASEDDGLTIVIWPGALGQYENFEIIASDGAPDSYGQAYQVRPNPELAVAAEVIVRGELPPNLAMARVGALSADDVAGGSPVWQTMPYREGSIDESAGTIHTWDDRIALYYAMIDDGMDPEPGTSSESGGETGPMTTSDTMDPTFPDMPTYETDIAPIWVGTCDVAGCHDASGGASGLVLVGDSYDNLVNAMSQNGMFTLVVPGNTNMSFLLAKITGPPPGTGDQMPPPPAPPLDAATSDVVVRWVTQGAPR